MSTTINKEEIQKFSNLANEWWDVNGKFKPLHMFNPIESNTLQKILKNILTLKIIDLTFYKGLKF